MAWKRLVLYSPPNRDRYETGMKSDAAVKGEILMAVLNTPGKKK
jgi:hypothetical protein